MRLGEFWNHATGFEASGSYGMHPGAILKFNVVESGVWIDSPGIQRTEYIAYLEDPDNDGYSKRNHPLVWSSWMDDVIVDEQYTTSMESLGGLFSDGVYISPGPGFTFVFVHAGTGVTKPKNYNTLYNRYNSPSDTSFATALEPNFVGHYGGNQQNYFYELSSTEITNKGTATTSGWLDANIEPKYHGSTSGYLASSGQYVYYIRRDILNLFVQGDDPKSISESFNLFIKGSIDSAQTTSNSLDLFVLGSQPSGALNLFINGYYDVLPSSSGSINLYVEGGSHSTNRTFDLFLYNNIESASRSMDLFIEGLGATPGYVPASGNVNLFLKGPLGSDGSIDLFISGKDSVESTFNLYTYGITGRGSGSFMLYTYGHMDVSGSFYLFTRGYVD